MAIFAGRDGGVNPQVADGETQCANLRDFCRLQILFPGEYCARIRNQS
jgi:hypothetical protein